MKLLGWFLDLLYPPKCVFCRRLLHREETEVCKTCRAELDEIGHSLKRGQFFDGCHSVFYYENTIAEALKRFKFGGRSEYAACFARMMAMRLLRERVEFDLITWAPVSRKRLRKRGYDQSYLLAREVAKELGAPCVRTLRKHKDRHPQSSQNNFAARQANALNAYEAVEPKNFYGKRVLVIDDVITSGATLSECCRVLKTAGAGSLVCATFAATPDK